LMSHPMLDEISDPAFDSFLSSAGFAWGIG
jgi:hypothetical protein